MTEEEVRWAECKIASNDLCIGVYNVIEHLSDNILPAVFGNYAASRAMLVALKIALNEDPTVALNEAHNKPHFTFNLEDVKTSAPETELQIYSMMFALYAYSRYGLVASDIIQKILDHFGSYQVIESKSKLGSNR